MLCGGVVGAGAVCGVLEGVLFGLLVVGGCSLMVPVEVPVEGLLPALPETLPDVLSVEGAALGAVGVAVVWPAIPPVALLELDPLLATVRSSFTFLTPGTDLASFFASFLSSLFGTEPLNVTLPSSTLI